VSRKETVRSHSFSPFLRVFSLESSAHTNVACVKKKFKNFWKFIEVFWHRTRLCTSHFPVLGCIFVQLSQSAGVIRHVVLTYTLYIAFVSMQPHRIPTYNKHVAISRIICWLFKYVVLVFFFIAPLCWACIFLCLSVITLCNLIWLYYGYQHQDVFKNAPLKFHMRTHFPRQALATLKKNTSHLIFATKMYYCVPIFSP